MGIGYDFVEALIRENQHRPIRGDVILIGRQTVYFSGPDLLALMRSHGMDLDGVDASDVEVDGNTIDRLSGYEHSKLISDRALFKLLGVPKVTALDHSDYEGAEIIHDLTKPIPQELVQSADFIMDGSTLDNVFDPAMVIRNYASMLRPGGRLLTTNVVSNHYCPYVMLPPLWYLDYFVANGFSDCKVYILIMPGESEGDVDPDGLGCNVFVPDLMAMSDPRRGISPFAAPGMITTTIVFAEKGQASTSHIMPSQQHYRQETEWQTYREKLALIIGSNRHHLVRSRSPIFFRDVRGGHLFIDNAFNACDPWTEIQKLSGPLSTIDPVCSIT